MGERRQNEGTERQLAPEENGVHAPKDTGVLEFTPSLHKHVGLGEHSGLGTRVPCLSESEATVL